MRYVLRKPAGVKILLLAEFGHTNMWAARQSGHRECLLERSSSSFRSVLRDVPREPAVSRSTDCLHTRRLARLQLQMRLATARKRMGCPAPQLLRCAPNQSASFPCADALARL